MLATVIGFMAAVIAAGAALGLWTLLGAFTGVLGMCSTAPGWWEFIYLLLGIAAPIFAVWFGCRAGKWYLDGCAARSDLP